MKRLCLYVFFAAFFLNMPAGIAQHPEQAAREAYFLQAHKFSNIFSGRIPESYPITFTVSYYLYSTRFIEGSLYYGGQYYPKLLLNINAHKDELYVLSPDYRTMVLLDPGLVQDLKIGVEDFVYYARGNQWGLPAGYYEVLQQAPLCLLKHTKRNYLEEVDRSTRVIDRYFEAVERYYLIKDGVVYPLTGRKSLLKTLSDHKRELSRWTAQRKLKDDAEGFYRQSVAYYVSLLKQD